MAKSKQKLKNNQFSDLAEAKIAEETADNKPAAFPAEKPGPNRIEPIRQKSLSKIILVTVFLVIFGAFGVALIIDYGESGDFEISDLTAKEVVVNINSQPQIVTTNAATVEGLLAELEIELGPDDYMDTRLSQPIVNGMKIWMRLSIPITIIDVDEVYEIESQPITVENALAKAGISLDADDQISEPLLAYLYEATEVKIIRIGVERITVEEYIEQPEKEVTYDYLAPEQGRSFPRAVRGSTNQYMKSLTKTV